MLLILIIIVEVVREHHWNVVAGLSDPTLELAIGVGVAGVEQELLLVVLEHELLLEQGLVVLLVLYLHELLRHHSCC